MNKNPVIYTVNGEGKPRLFVLKDYGDEIYTSAGALTISQTSISEADGSAVTISTSTAENPTKINTAAVHGRSVGDFILIASHTGSTPSINGVRRVDGVIDTDTLQIAIDVSVGGTGGTLKRTPGFISRGVVAGMRVRGVVSFDGIVTGEKETYTTVVNVTSENAIEIDGWNNGIPDSGTIYIDGFVIDLPRCQKGKLRERFIPDLVIHKVWRNRKITKFYGYDYTASLDYSQYASGDLLIALKPMLNRGMNDRIILMPKVDAPEFHYEVMMNSPIDLAMFGLTKGYEGLALVFESTIPLAGMPISSTGYGFGYGLNYGIQL